MNKLSSLLMGIISSTFLLGSSGFASDLEIENTKDDYKTVRVTAVDLKGVNIFLSKEISKDCRNREVRQQFHLLTHPESPGFSARYLVDAYVTTYIIDNNGVIKCPTEEVVQERIFSKPYFIPSKFDKKFSDGIILIQLTVPKGWRVDVEEVR